MALLPITHRIWCSRPVRQNCRLVPLRTCCDRRVFSCQASTICIKCVSSGCWPRSSIQRTYWRWLTISWRKFVSTKWPDHRNEGELYSLGLLVLCRVYVQFATISYLWSRTAFLARVIGPLYKNISTAPTVIASSRPSVRPLLANAACHAITQTTRGRHILKELRKHETVAVNGVMDKSFSIISFLPLQKFVLFKLDIFQVTF